MDFFSRFKAPKRSRSIEGEIYVLHFERPYKHARHYIGWARKGKVEDRLQQHLSGQGSPLVKAVVEAGIPVVLADVFPGTRDMERHLKNRHDNRGVCPICRKEWLEKKKMKKTVKEVREMVRSLLREAICPVCGGKGAYIGLNDAECPNKACPKFSVKQLQAGDHTPGIKTLTILDTNLDVEKKFASSLGLRVEDISREEAKISPAWPFLIAVRFTGPEDKIKELILHRTSQTGEIPQDFFDLMEDA